MLSRLTRLAWPVARLWARRGYFDPPDLANLEPRRVALVACHWLGDTFWATQVVPALRDRWGGAEVYAITKPASRDLWSGLIEPERVLEAPQVVSDRRRERVRWRAMFRRARELSGLDLDLVIDLTGNRYSAAFAFWLRPRAAVGFEGGELGWLYSHRVSGARREGVHLSQQPFGVIQPLLGGRWSYPSQLRPPQPTAELSGVLEELKLSGPYVVIAPGAGWPEKEWPAQRFAQVAAQAVRAGVRVVVVGSADQEALCGLVAASAGADARVAAGWPIGKVVALLGGAAAVLANDSAVAHLSAALGRRTVAIFTGRTDPAVCGPLGPAGAVTVLVNPDVAAAMAALGVGG